jgi:nucleoside-diphosphate-sugar epimerase
MNIAKEKKILVIGGNGFLGNNLLRELLKIIKLYALVYVTLIIKNLLRGLIVKLFKQIF